MIKNRSSGGLLLEATKSGALDPIRWAEVDVGQGLVITVSADALKAPVEEAGRPIRLPVSYCEAVEICQMLGCIVPTAAFSDAIWRAAKIRIRPMPLVLTPEDAQQMSTLLWSIRHDTNISRYVTDENVLVADVGKDWVLDNGIGRAGAVNYGWRQFEGETNSFKLIQSLGHCHNEKHWDYSQVLRVVDRRAKLDDRPVDLIEYLAEKIEAKILSPFR